MTERKKRLIKQEIGLLRQAEKHRKKIEEEAGRKDTTHEYWRKEISEFERRARERARLLEKLKKGK
mgnify:FL=1